MSSEFSTANGFSRKMEEGFQVIKGRKFRTQCLVSMKLGFMVGNGKRFLKYSIYHILWSHGVLKGFA